MRRSFRCRAPSFTCGSRWAQFISTRSATDCWSCSNHAGSPQVPPCSTSRQPQDAQLHTCLGALIASPAVAKWPSRSFARKHFSIRITPPPLPGWYQHARHCARRSGRSDSNIHRGTRCHNRCSASRHGEPTDGLPIHKIAVAGDSGSLSVSA